MHNQMIGKTFALTSCKAWTSPDNEETQISGLFMVEELVYPDRSCGQYEGGFWVFRAEDAGTGEGPMWFVDGDTFFEQTDPQGYGRMLRIDRDSELYAEDVIRREDFTQGITLTDDKPF